MVRKATELKDLKELNLDSRTRAQIKQRMKTKGWSLEDLVSVVRRQAFYNTARGMPFDSGAVWLKASIRALDEAGFIRHDIVYYDNPIYQDARYEHLRKIDIHIEMARKISRFYKRVFTDNSSAAEAGNVVLEYIEYLENLRNPFNRYEEDNVNFSITTDYRQFHEFLGHVYSIIDNVRGRKSDSERLIKILSMSCGFVEADKRCRTLGEIAKVLCIRETRTKLLECKAIGIVRTYCTLLPPITDFISVESF